MLFAWFMVLSFGAGCLSGFGLSKVADARKRMAEVMEGAE